jgi:hypothetical protein
MEQPKPASAIVQEFSRPGGVMRQVASEGVVNSMAGALKTAEDGVAKVTHCILAAIASQQSQQLTVNSHS